MRTLRGQAKLETEEQQLAAAASQLEVLQARQAELSSSIKPLTKQLAAAHKAAAEATAEETASKVSKQVCTSVCMFVSCVGFAGAAFLA
jgi:outer membrane murein-binding lipoprotein Lpp